MPNRSHPCSHRLRGSRSRLRPLRGSAFGLGQPDGFAAGASRSGDTFPIPRSPFPPLLARPLAAPSGLLALLVGQPDAYGAGEFRRLLPSVVGGYIAPYFRGRAGGAPHPSLSFKIPHLFSALQYEIIHIDLNRKVGIIGMRREDFALVTGSNSRHHLILYEEECLKKR